MATNPQLPLELSGTLPTAGVSYGARIKRYDGQFYDPSDGTFKSLAAITTPFVALSPGTGTDISIQSAYVSMVPGNWVDGDYFVYFHDTSNVNNIVVWEDQIQVFGGTWASIRTPTTTEIALRMFTVNTGAHTQAGTFGGDFNLIKKQLAYIGAYIQSVSGKPFPTS
jgi:hypothetical protein